MSASVGLLESPLPADVSRSLGELRALPDWLEAALRPERVIAAIERHVPEFASGELKLRGCKIKRLVLKEADGRWIGTYTATVEGPQAGQRHAVALRGVLTAPALRSAPAQEPGEPLAFGAAGWRCVLPELGLELEIEPPDTALAAMPQLTDPEESRALLERSISAGAPAYRDMRIQACAPQVLSYKPGSRCTIRYRLEYPPDLAAERGWPETVIAKTYRKSKGQNAYDGMRKLWDSPLSRGDIVTIAEPLAYIPELKVLVQGPVPEERTLEELVTSALVAGTPEALEELHHFMRMAARGLVALHQSGARHGELVSWEDRIADIRELIDRLAVPVPELVGAVEPLVAWLQTFGAAHPADPAVPTHGTFDPEQVLISQGEISLIDFDDFCLAEPAMDVGLFLAAIKDLGLKAGAEALVGRDARLARLDQTEAIGEVFVAQYEALAPISRQRIALWQALDFVSDALHCWSKVKLGGSDNDMLILEHHLRGLNQ